MKRSARTYILSAAIVLLLSISFNQTALSQPPPPPPGGGHGLGGNQGGAQQGAPIGGGLGIFLLLGAAYAGGKAYKVKSEERKVNSE